jgi:hypothetical protein
MDGRAGRMLLRISSEVSVFEGDFWSIFPGRML